MSSAVSAACGNHSAEGEHHSGVYRKSVRLRYRNSVHLAGGIAFTFPPECRSASLRNRVRMRPDSSYRSGKSTWIEFSEMPYLVIVTIANYPSEWIPDANCVYQD